MKKFRFAILGAGHIARQFCDAVSRIDGCEVCAVASANATNPISIFVPCHRVIGSNHKLTGYGGGLDAKKGLLELECSKTMGLGLW